MKKLFLLTALFLIPLFVFAQETSTQEEPEVTNEREEIRHNRDMIANYLIMQKIIKKYAIISNQQLEEFSIFEIKDRLRERHLDSYLKNEKNRILLASISDYITSYFSDYYAEYNSWYYYTVLVYIGVDPLEAAVRIKRDLGNDEYINDALERGSICDKPDTPNDCIDISTDHKIVQERIEKIERKLDEEKPLVENFQKEAEKSRHNLRIVLRRMKKSIDTFGVSEKYGDMPLPEPGYNFMHW